MPAGESRSPSHGQDGVERAVDERGSALSSLAVQWDPRKLVAFMSVAPCCSPAPPPVTTSRESAGLEHPGLASTTTQLDVVVAAVDELHGTLARYSISGVLP